MKNTPGFSNALAFIMLLRLLQFIRKHWLLTFFIIGVLFLIFSDEKEKPIQSQSAAPSLQTTLEPNEEIPVSMPSQTTPTAQDGNSMFAKNLLLQLPEDEHKQYAQSFYLHMKQGAPNSIQAWKTESGQGVITSGEWVEGASGTLCRTYAERYTVGSASQERNGVACQNKQGGWCKLRSTSVRNCAIKSTGGLLGAAKVDWHNFKTNTNSFFYGLKNMF